jgi:hypothetical protein
MLSDSGAGHSNRTPSHQAAVGVTMRMLAVLALLLCSAAAVLGQAQIPESCYTLPGYPNPPGEALK